MIPPLFDFGFVYEWVSLKEIASFSKFHFPLKLIITRIPRRQISQIGEFG